MPSASSPQQQSFKNAVTHQVNRWRGGVVDLRWWLRLQVGCDYLTQTWDWDALILHSCRTWCQCACCGHQV